MLKPSSKSQEEMIIAGLSEILIRAAEGDEAIFCLPGPGTKFNLSSGLTLHGHQKWKGAKMFLGIIQCLGCLLRCFWYFK